MATCGIYRIKNKQNGKFYLGSSVGVEERFYNHRSQLNRNIHDNQYLQNAWNKYGELNFEFIVLKKCNPCNLVVEEQKELDIHFGKEYCYNLSPSADVSMRGVPRSEEVKWKISVAQKGKARWTEEQKKQMSIDRMGRTHSSATKNKMKNRNSSFENIRMAQQFNIGRTYSDEHRKHISDSKSKIPKSEYETIKSLYLSGEMNKQRLAFKYGVYPSSMKRLLQRIGVQ